MFDLLLSFIFTEQSCGVFVCVEVGSSFLVSGLEVEVDMCTVLRQQSNLTMTIALNI